LIVTGTLLADLGLSKLELAQADRARLRPFQHSLSEYCSPGFYRHQFVQAPCGHTPQLVRRVRDALAAAGLPHANNPHNLGENSARGRVFRELYSGVR
jgi:hypothetical protein